MSFSPQLAKIAATNADELEERKTIREPNCERLKVPIHYTTSTITPRCDEDPELFIALLRLTPFAVCSMSTDGIHYMAVRRDTKGTPHTRTFGPLTTLRGNVLFQFSLRVCSNLPPPLPFQLVTLHRSQCTLFSQCFLRLKLSQQRSTHIQIFDVFFRGVMTPSLMPAGPDVQRMLDHLH